MFLNYKSRVEIVLGASLVRIGLDSVETHRVNSWLGEGLGILRLLSVLVTKMEIYLCLDLCFRGPFGSLGFGSREPPPPKVGGGGGSFYLFILWIVMKWVN